MGETGVADGGDPRYLNEMELSGAIGAEAAIGRTLHLGIGCSLKSVRLNIEPACVVGKTLEGKGIAFDLGALVSADLLREAKWKISPGVGFSARNLGEDIEFMGERREEPSVLQESYRLGASLRIEGPKSDAIAGIVGAELPLIVVTVNGDLFDVARREGYGGVGAEVALLHALFVRVGRMAFAERGREDHTL